MSLVSDEQVISLLHAKVYVFSYSVLCLGKIHENTQSNSAWEERLTWFKSSPEYRTLDTIDREPMDFEWNIFPGFTTLQLCNKVQELLSQMSKQPEEFTGRIIFMSMFNDISRGFKENEQECEFSAKLVSIYAKRFSPGRWSILGLGSEKKWYSTYNERPQGEWDRVAELMMIKFRESGHPVFRATSPLSRGVQKTKVVENYQYTCALLGERFEIVFRTIISVNQSSIYGAVSDLYEEYKVCHVRTGRPVLAGQSDPLFELKSSLIKTPTLSTDGLAQEDPWLEYQERVETHNKIV